MRAYLAVTPEDLSELLQKGSHPFQTAYVLSTAFAQANPDLDEEELEFELSWIAAQTSRAKGKVPESPGFVLAVDLTNDQIGKDSQDQVEVQSEILWSQVESILVSETSEPELTWYASQELTTYLPQWMA